MKIDHRNEKAPTTRVVGFVYSRNSTRFLGALRSGSESPGALGQ
jgi:hypothetical protein